MTLQTSKTARPQRGLMLAAALAAAFVSSACAPLVIGGAMVGGALVATDRRTSGTQVEDKGIEVKASSRIKGQISDNAHVTVSSYNRLVLLTGEVPNEADRAKLESIVSGVENVRSVLNETAVMPASSLGSRSNDVLISSKVKASLLDAPELISNAFYVVVERGTVFLMGRVTEREATRAATIARSISGVQKVVRAFDIISEEELARIVPAPASTPKPAAE
ncbi:BON domain-containing protein [Paucibacter sp. AS339]|uniref:BON domain-containing protein n=1 Tax=Paucibacter hankyongi TaxID=3133434 RepID=UPI0030A4D6F0